jgi:hypothetical protein
MKKLLFLLLLVSQSASASVFCQWPSGLGHVMNLSQAQGPHYVGEPFVLKVDRDAAWSIQLNGGQVQNLGTYPAGVSVGLNPATTPGQYTLRAFRVTEGYCTLDDIVLAALSVGTITASGSLWTVNSITFSASVSGGANPKTYAWTFGDGGTSTAQSPTHSYNKAGTFAVSLTVRDTNGRQSSRQRNFTIVNNPNVPGQPTNLVTNSLGCPDGYTADTLAFWQPTGPQPSNTFEIQSKVTYLSNWSSVIRASGTPSGGSIFLRNLQANKPYDIRIRGCINTSSSTCGPYLNSQFTTPVCGSGPLD